MVFAKVVGAAALLCVVDGVRVSRHSKASCGIKGPSANSRKNGTNIQIVNGEDATPGEWKWQIGLRNAGSNGKGQIWCGGMLVSDTWAVTAAHCCDDPKFDVVVGAYRMRAQNDKEQTRAALQVITHPRYNPRTTNFDFALIKLSSPVVFNEYVGPVCLPEAGDIAVGSKCWISGWGTLKSGGSQPDKLQEGEVSIISNDDCTGKFEYREGQITPAMLCAQGETDSGRVVDACQGDSGGPLVCEDGGVWTLYGATSWGAGCAARTHPGIWARIWDQIDWIEETMANPPAPTEPPSICDTDFACSGGSFWCNALCSDKSCC